MNNQENLFFGLFLAAFAAAIFYPILETSFPLLFLYLSLGVTSFYLVSIIFVIKRERMSQTIETTPLLNNIERKNEK